MMDFPDDSRLALMLLSAMIEPGDADLDDLIGESGPVEALRQLLSGKTSSRLGTAATAFTRNCPDPRAKALAIRTSTEACGARFVIPGDTEWPLRPADLTAICTDREPHLRPPRGLWVKGSGSLANLTNAKSTAIVGSRAATEYGKHVADDLAADLGEAGWSVVSGGALGIDRAAHVGALARGGATVAVLAGGVDVPYPSANARVFDLIAERGLLLSEYPPGSTVSRNRFLARNRLIAALTDATIAVECGLRSGTRNTMRHAAALGRLVAFTPGPITSGQSEGIHDLARSIPGARLVTRAEEVIADVAAARSGLT